MKHALNIKAKISTILVLVFAMISSTVNAGAVESVVKQEDNLFTASFDVEDDGLHTTACVLVKDGVAYALSREEYIELKNTYEFTDCAITQQTEIDDTPTPRFSFFYTFTPKSRTYAFYDNLAGRICAIYGKADRIVLKQKMTYTRTVTESGSISMTTSIKDIIDMSVSSSYSLSVSAASSTDTEIAGEFKPSGNYEYVSVVFTPRLATVKGDLKWWQRFENEDSVLSTTPCTIIYPAGRNGLLDGIYERVESNNRNSFPEMV